MFEIVFSKPFIYYMAVLIWFFTASKIFSQTDFYSRYNESSKKYVEGKYDEALQINLKLLAIAEQSKIPKQIAFANLQVGNMYYFLQNKKAAVKWYMNALAVVEAEKLDSMRAELYHNISVMYNEMHNNDSTLKYSQKAIAIFRAEKKYAELSRALSALVDIYINNNKDLKEAEKLITESEKCAKMVNDESMLAYALSKRAALYGKQHRYKEAAEQLKIPEEIYRKNHVADELMYLYRLGANYYTKICDPRGLSYMDSLLRLKDSIFKKESAKKVAEYETLYQTEKKEKENKLLQQQNTLKTLEIENNAKKIKIRNQTIYILAAIIVMTLVIVLWQISLARIKKQKQELEAEKKLQQDRERISRDLHDNVGGQLSYVLFSLEAEEEHSVEKRKEKSANLAAAVRSVTGNLRETIWALNQENLTLKDISDKLKLYTRNIFSYTETKIRFEENIENDEALNPAFALNLFRVCQEIINNAFKHAQASELIISISRKEKITIHIADNGKGFSMNQSKNENFGLNNLKKRADEINATLTIKSELNNGTQITLVV